ncbi:hypothetical protein EJ903_11180 [Azospirillum griseum]|uniref:OmpA-like domain-containing protein n=2 Tax=Azospirillum griseum TaxID=2496639 RepID=A0A3S0R9B5_9PROT|nr:hypothetical protein EJ903_11180 [Azospirillum griseum]
MALCAVGLGASGLVALSATPALSAQAQPATVKTTTTPPPAAPKLSLENATPAVVPGRPNLGTPPKVIAPPRFVTPVPFDAPAPPELVEGPAKPAPRPAQTAKTAPTPVPVAPAATPVTAPVQTAALPPASLTPAPAPTAPVTAAPIPASALTLALSLGATSLPDSADSLVDDILRRLRGSDTARLQLRSYASGSAETAREARQLSLARALSLRERLTAFGVRSSRIDVRALGIDTQGGGPADRIDIEFLNE